MNTATNTGLEDMLSGVRIVELGHVLAAPFTTSLFADFGAEVIKVEGPDQGDMMRGMGPDKDGVKLWWKVAGRNKKCVTLNLKDPRGLALCRRLIAEADAVVENFRPGVLAKLGLGHEDMRAVNPRLIIVSISGYGLTGPAAAKPGYGRIAEAYSGVMHLTGDPDGEPLTPGFSMADVTTGVMGAFALAMALYRRDARGGKPVTIDMGLHETVSRMIDWQVIMHDQLGVVPKRTGNKYPFSGAFITNVCKDRNGKWLTVSGPASVMRKLLGLLGVADDPRFATDQELYRSVKAFDDLLVAWILRRTRDEALKLLEEAGATCGPIYDVADIVADPQYRERGLIATVDDEELGPVRMVGVVPRIPDAPGAIRWTGPARGQHNDEVLGGLLKIGKAELEALKRDGVI
jgi:crotonobetainyl-CoA:carnitine CoA-transferase CaiB-like acyl-CoA transferase